MTNLFKVMYISYTKSNVSNRMLVLIGLCFVELHSYSINAMCEIVPTTIPLKKPLHIVKGVVVIFREVFSIRLIIHPVIHPWMASYKEENLGINK